MIPRSSWPTWASTWTRRETLSTSAATRMAGKGPFIKTLFAWLTVLTSLLAEAPTGVLSWDGLKNCFLRLFDRRPKAIPSWCSDAKRYSTLDAAEECATALKAMAYSLRRCKLYPEKSESAFTKASAAERDKVLELVVVEGLARSGGGIELTGESERD